MLSNDILAIQQQIAGLSYTFDSGDAEGFAKIFTIDGLWEYYPTGATQPALRLEGNDALRDYCLNRVSERSKSGIISYHHQSGIFFDELTTDSAKVRTMLIITTHAPGKNPQIFMTGTYEDLWVKTPDGWRIKNRVLRP
jgi:hypothetical protein